MNHLLLSLNILTVYCVAAASPHSSSPGSLLNAAAEAATVETKNDNRIGSRLVGASVDAEDCEFPYQASLRIKGEHKCGGALLNHRYLITSAHCVSKYKLESFIIVLGSNSLLSGGIAFRAQEAILHPEYQRSGHHHDLALVKLSKPVRYSRAIAPVKLARNNDVPRVLTLTGWPSGERKISAQKSASDFNLKVLRLPIIELDDCRAVFPSVTDSNLCTLSPVLGEGLCYGDAGSPLVADGVLHAIGSWGSPCANRFPDIHQKIFDHIEWIRSCAEIDDN